MHVQESMIDTLERASLAQGSQSSKNAWRDMAPICSASKHAYLDGAAGLALLLVLGVQGLELIAVDIGEAGALAGALQSKQVC